MWWPDEESGPLYVVITRWGWHWLALYRYCIYPDQSAALGDHLQFWSLDLGPLALKLPQLRWRRDLR